jgi:hypothetical protein
MIYSRELARDSTKLATEEGSSKFSMPISHTGSARLQDFIILKMIGKGTFGKVYLV